MKKLISILLAIALCVGALPMTAFALETVYYLNENGERTPCTSYEVVTKDTTTLVAGKTYVVNESTEINSKVTGSGTGTINLVLCDNTTLNAKNGIQMGSGTTLNIYACSTGENRGKLEVGAYSYSADEEPPESISISCYNLGIYGGEVTATGGSGDVSKGIWASNGLTVKNAKLKAMAGFGEHGQSSISSYGTLTFENADLTVNTNLRLASGSFSKITVEDLSDLSDMCISGKYFINSTSNAVQKTAGVTSLSNVKIGECTHINSVDDEHNQCACGQKQFAARIDTTYYATLSDAISNAKNCIVTLLADCTNNIVIENIITTPGDFVLDLNGHTISSLSSTLEFILKDSKGGGEIETLTLGGDVTLHDILPVGWGLYEQTSGGKTWHDRSGTQTIFTSFSVGVAQLPIQSLTITASPKKDRYTYGDTVELSATVTQPEGKSDSVTYKWEAKYPNSEDWVGRSLSGSYQESFFVGTTQIRVTATVDGYTKTTETTYEADKATLTTDQYAAPVANTLTYNSVSQQLVTEGSVAPSVSELTMWYKLSSQDKWSIYPPTAVDAGTYTVQWYIKGNDNYNGVHSKENPGTIEVTIAPIALSVTVNAYEKDYDGTTAADDVAVTLGGAALEDNEYTLTNAYLDSANAGTNKTVTVTVTLNNPNYCFTNGARSCTVTGTGEIRKATPTAPTGLKGYVGNKLSTIDLPDGWAWDKPDNIIHKDIPIYSATYTDTTGNYNNDTVGLSVTRNQKSTKDLTVTMDGWTYGEPAKTPQYTVGTDGYNVVVEYRLSTGVPLENVPTDAGDYQVSVVYETLTEEYRGFTRFTISPATPTGEPKYTKITTGGKTLADAELTTVDSTFSTAGTVEWVDDSGTTLAADTAVEKNTEYTWKFTPTSGNYTAITGKVTLWAYVPPVSNPGYTPTVTQPSVGGSVEVSNPAPTEGETVTVTPNPDSGYVIDTIKVTDSTGKTIEISRNSDGTFDFTQPDGNVTVEVTYKEKPTFKDVPANAWYGEALDFAVENGLVSGTSATTFEPDSPMTRAMFATVLWNFAGKQSGFTGSFSDIKNGDWFQDAVAWASQSGIVSGHGDGTFEPNTEITREQMVVMLWNFAGKPESSGELTSFTDAGKVSSWAQTAMAWAVENGIISGKGNSVLDPLGTATRAEVTAMIVNFVNK